MHRFAAKPTGAGGCQIALVAQYPTCPNKAAVRRWTGRKWIALCKRHNLPAIGPLETAEHTVIVGSTSGAVEAVVTEAKKPPTNATARP